MYVGSPPPPSARAGADDYQKHPSLISGRRDWLDGHSEPVTAAAPKKRRA